MSCHLISLSARFLFHRVLSDVYESDVYSCFLIPLTVTTIVIPLCKSIQVLNTNIHYTLYRYPVYILELKYIIYNIILFFSFAFFSNNLRLPPQSSTSTQLNLPHLVLLLQSLIDLTTSFRSRLTFFSSTIYNM